MMAFQTDAFGSESLALHFRHRHRRRTRHDRHLSRRTGAKNTSRPGLCDKSDRAVFSHSGGRLPRLATGADIAFRLRRLALGRADRHRQCGVRLVDSIARVRKAPAGWPVTGEFRTRLRQIAALERSVETDIGAILAATWVHRPLRRRKGSFAEIWNRLLPATDRDADPVQHISGGRFLRFHQLGADAVDQPRHHHHPKPAIHVSDRDGFALRTARRSNPRRPLRKRNGCWFSRRSASVHSVSPSGRAGSPLC